VLGVGAWLLGGVSATAGSLYAVDQLGQGLLTQHAKEISVATVNTELALENSNRTTPPAAPYPSPSTTHPVSRAQHGSGTPPADRPTRHVQRQKSKLLTSPGGTAAASCHNGLARLLYWSPALGFEANDVNERPARVATVTFTDNSGGVKMRIACRATGVPYAYVSKWTWSGPHHDE